MDSERNFTRIGTDAYYSPFLDVRSFEEAEEEAAPARAEESVTRGQPASPFLAVYESEGEGRIDPQTEEYAPFLNELYDEQFSEALSSLVDEAAAVYEGELCEHFARPPYFRLPGGTSPQRAFCAARLRGGGHDPDGGV